MKSLVLYDKKDGVVWCCGLDIYDCRGTIENLCYKANSELNNSGEDKYIVCEIDGNCWDYQREELACLCDRYCEQMDRKK